MCTVITALEVWADEPLVIAANRDEQLRRPSEPPARRDWGPRAVLAPRDAVAGGTWWGLSDRGLFVAITNRAGRAPDAQRRSRGRIVVDALQAATLDEAVALVAGFGPRDHNPFHLVLTAAAGSPAAGGPRPRAHVVWSDDEALHERPLGPGVHVVTERSLGAGSSAREILAHELLAPQAERERYPGDEALKGVLAYRTDDPWNSLAVSVPELGYGTRSSTLVKLGRPGEPIRLAHADGPPPGAAWASYDADVV